MKQELKQNEQMPSHGFCVQNFVEITVIDLLNVFYSNAFF